MRAGMRLALMAVLVIAAGLLAARAADDPLMGTWKLNVAKSKYDPGPPPTSLIRKHEPAPNGIKVTSHATRADGKTFTNTIEGTFPNGQAVHNVHVYDKQ